MKISFCLFILLCFVSCSQTDAPYYGSDVIENNLIPAVEFENAAWSQFTVQERMKHYGVSAFSIALIDDGDIVWTQAYGTYSKNSQQPISTNTIFQAASLSKPITAFGIMALVDTGALELNDPVNDYLKTWKLPESEYTAQPIKISGLLSHTAGISVPSYSGYDDSKTIPNIDQILDGISPANSDPVRVIMAPGKYAYSGGGYMILQKVIEDQTGKTLNGFMEANLFAPLLLTRTTFNILNPEVEQDDIALGGNWIGETYESGWRVYPEQAAASLWTTPNDMALILQSFMAAYKGQKNVLFSKETAHLMTEGIDNDMGLGFGVHGEGEGKHIDHAGWTRGYRSYMVAFPEIGDGVVLMANSNGGDRLIQEMTRAIAKELKWPAYQPEKLNYKNWTQEQLSALAGDYKMMPAGFTISILAKDNHFIISTPRGSIYTAYPISNSELVTIENGRRIIISGDENIELSMWGMKAVRLN